MSLKVFVASIVGVLLLGAATVYGAAVVESRHDQERSQVEVLVATKDIPACTGRDQWADSMELRYFTPADIPAGALASTDVVAQQDLLRDVAAGDVILAQFFGLAEECPARTE